MSTPYIAQISIFPYSFAPRSWSFCAGQAVSLNTHSALFSLIGTTYGGDGLSSFNLPDMKGRVGVQAGRGAGLSDYQLGQSGGEEEVTLLPHNLPPHSHALTNMFGPNTNTNDISGAYLSSSQAFYAPNHQGTESLAGVSPTSESGGGSQPHNNMMPFQVLNFCIAMQGDYPSRN